MSGLVDGILGQLGPSGLSQIAKGLGADESDVGAAVAAALPTIIAGMANNTKQPAGAESLANALNDHSPSVFDALGSLLGGGGDGAAILGHVLGGRQPTVEQGLAKKTGVDLNLIMKLLPILAPLVMGYLSKQKQEQQLDPGGLGSVLNEERQRVETKEPGLGGLASLLDADGDGSVIDDILGKLTGQ
ncbi:MAG: DUF937 domain-containing protein [Acidimicrobiales bacterium]